jgi:allantoinase
LKLPGHAKKIVWTTVNLEVCDVTRAMARQVLPAPTGVPLLPELPNWARHEYGMRVGFWRSKKLYDSLVIKLTLSINGRFGLTPRV